jgi:hypothetical protein
MAQSVQELGCGLDDGGVGVRLLVEVEHLFFLHNVQTSSGVHLALCRMATGEGGCFPGNKRPRREADYSYPPSVEVKNTWGYTSTPPYVFLEDFTVSLKSPICKLCLKRV